MTNIDWKGGTIKMTAIVIPSLAIISAAYMNLANQTAVAIEIAKQHGHELLIVRQEVSELRGALQTNMDDRFRRADFDREKEFIMHVISELENRVQRLEDRQ